MAKVKINGTGQLNGPVSIRKEFEMYDKLANNLHGAKREQMLADIMATHYPGVRYNPRQISINISRK
ncbi:MAG: hypothetical protein HC905_32005 [Bacteroidales bacterium]|nr:hypothetical protein [Bacteroidales bacterium]